MIKKDIYGNIKNETSREKGTIISVTDKKVEEDGIEILPLVSFWGLCRDLLVGDQYILSL